MIAATNLIVDLANETTQIIPGHGRMIDRAELIGIRDVLVAIAAKIRTMVDEGKSQAEIVAAKPTEEWDAQWGTGWMSPDKFVEITVRGMTKPRGE